MVNKTKKFKKMMDMFCKNMPPGSKSVSFYYKGIKLDAFDTIESIVDNNAQIDAFVDTFGKYLYFLKFVIMSDCIFGNEILTTVNILIK